MGSGDGAAPPRSTIVGPASQLPSSDGPNTYSIAIYPYVSERDDEFDVNVGDTFIVLSKAKGWWVVQRDSLGEGIGDVEEIEGEDNSREVEIRSGWVPAGCLLETSQPLAKVMTPAVESPMAAAQAQGPNAANASHGGAVSSAASTPTGPTTPHGDVDMATAPIPPSVITSTSTPGIMLMDYKAADDKLSLNKDDKLRVFKR